MKLDQETVQEWINNLNVELKAEYEAGYSNLTWNPIKLQTGRKWFKLMHGSSVWGFVAKEDGTQLGVAVNAGDLMKPANFRAPARHSRGNILDGTARYKWTGPHYL